MEILERRFTIASVERKLLVIVTHDGEVFLKCRDMARMLGYRDSKSAISRHVPRDMKYRYEDIVGGENFPPFRGEGGENFPPLEGSRPTPCS